MHIEKRDIDQPCAKPNGTAVHHTVLADRLNRTADQQKRPHIRESVIEVQERSVPLQIAQVFEQVATTLGLDP